MSVSGGYPDKLWKIQLEDSSPIRWNLKSFSIKSVGSILGNMVVGPHTTNKGVLIYFYPINPSMHYGIMVS